MAWQRETLADLLAQAETRITGAVGLVSPIFDVAVARAIAHVLSAARHGLNGAIAYGVKQIHPQTADEENLTRMAEADGVFRLSRTFARYTTGVSSGTSGTLIPAGSVLTAPNGQRYKVLAEAYVPSPVTVVAEVVGTRGNQLPLTTLTFQPTISNVGATVTIDGGVDGVEDEPLEVYRARYLEARRAEKLGGHETEYTKAAKKVPGVTRVWVYPFEFGLGTLGVYFVRDGDPSILPDAEELAQVSTEIAKFRPGTAQVLPDFLRGPTALQTLNISIHGVASSALRSKITDELKDMVWSKAEIGDSVSRGAILENDIRRAISRITTSYTLLTTGDHICGLGNLMVFGAVTWSVDP